MGQAEQLERLQQRLLRGEIDDVEFADQMAQIMADEPPTGANPASVALVLAALVMVAVSAVGAGAAIWLAQEPESKRVVVEPQVERDCTTASECHAYAQRHDNAGRAAEALGLYERACDLGEPAACYAAGWDHLEAEPPNGALGRLYLGMGCDYGHADSCGTMCSQHAMYEPFAYSLAQPFCQRSYELNPTQSARGDLAEVLVILGDPTAKTHLDELYAVGANANDHVIYQILRIAAGQPRAEAGAELLAAYERFPAGEQPGWLWGGMLHHLDTAGDPHRVRPLIDAVDRPRTAESTAQLARALAD